jgi:AraC family transcriptional regulator, regulatory protein of adaptative response / methylated-DNA-[protein]-cysteine methyltransferase
MRNQLQSKLPFEEAWRIREERDARYDGSLFVAVTSTHVYCKPSCPSRSAKPGNVRFFQSWEEAEQAGFRPCLRCKPRAENSDAVLVKAVTRYIETHPDELVTLSQLGQATGTSPFHLQRTFKKATGITPKSWANNQRLQRFQNSLRTAASVTDAVYEAGFAASSRAYEDAQEKLGMKPAAWRKGGEGADISYTIAPTEFGFLLAAATDRGICCVMLGDSVEEMEAEFQKDFARARRTRDEKLSLVVDQILVLITAQGPSPHLPLDVRATAFQQRVWEYLRAIPRGETRSYSQVAVDLNQPSATRAVARACASNPVALVVPCHRVVSADGQLTGYRWGVERKRKLLEAERVAGAHT